MKTTLFPSFWTSLFLLCVSAAPLTAEQSGLFTYRIRVSAGTSGYDLRLLSVDALSALDEEGESLVILALVGESLHIRIFDADGDRVADESEDESGRWQALSAEKEVMIANPWVDEFDVGNVEKGEFIRKASRIVLGVAEITDYPEDTVGDIVIPSWIDGLSVTTIGRGAFSGCSLTSLTIPNSVTTIDNYAFSNCSSLTSVTIPNSVTSIAKWAFSRCTGLTSVTIPNSVTTIGSSAFSGCSSLTSIAVAPDNAHYASEEGVLFNLDQTRLIRCPEGRAGAYAIPSSVTTIAWGAFSGCTGLTSLTIPNSVTTIGEWAFDGCSSLTSVIIPNSVTTIGDRAFRGCSSLTSVTIPNSVTTIGHGAFSSCSSLTSVTIPNSVTTIGHGAFSSCSSLTSVTIPNSVTTIGREAFEDCSGLIVATFLGHAPTYLADYFYPSKLFQGTAPDFTIYYLSRSTGFTSKEWSGYPARRIDDGDPVVDERGMSLSYLAAIPGLSLTPETSIDLKTWTTEGVSLSEIDENNHRYGYDPQTRI